MKFRCERDVLVDALVAAGRAVPKAATQPILAGIRLELVLPDEHLIFTGHDRELTVSVRVRRGVQSDSGGAIVVPARLAADVARSLPPGGVEVTVDEEHVRIAAGRAEFSLRAFADDDFPRILAPSGDPVTLPVTEFAAGLRQVIPAASNDEARPILTGVLVSAEGGGLRLVATDSYRLAVRDLPGQSVLSEGQSVLVPSRALNELTKVLGTTDDLKLRLGEREASFETEDIRLTSVLIEGDFPPYRGLIPSSYPNRLIVGRDALLEALRRVRLLAREATPVRLAMSTEGAELVAVTQDVGQAHEMIDAKFEGTELTTAFNPDYLIQGLEVMAGDEAVIETVDALKPAVLRSPESQEFLYLLMPVRVS